MILKNNGDEKMFIDNDEDTIYKKKSKKPATKKTNHKHDYSETVLIRRVYNGNESYHSAKRCSICQKTSCMNFFETIPYMGNSKLNIMLNEKEILEKYKDVPIVNG